MKRLKLILLAGLSVAGGTMAMAQTKPAITTCEYWFDYEFDSRTSEPMANEGTLSKTFDVSAMSKGVHSIGIRFGDNQGLWTPPFIKSFVIPQLPHETFDGNKIMRIDYWTDNDYEARKSVVPQNGNVAMELDFSSFYAGVHSLTYQAFDERGLATAPFVKHFVIPTQAQPEAKSITAYEYWFNYGQRVRVEVDPQTPLKLNDLVIEIKDVLPVTITQDYVFDPTTEMVTQPDNVFFGIQAFNDAEVASAAMLSEKFAFDVPVNPEFITLEQGVVHDFANRGAGTMQGFKVNTTPGDSVRLSITAGGQLDFYESDGKIVKADKSTDALGNTVYALVPTSNTIYALLWNVPILVNDMQIAYEMNMVNGVESATAPTGVSVRSGKGWFSVTTPKTGHVSVVSAQGATIVNDNLSVGTTTYHVAQGIYLVRFNNEEAMKVLIK